MEALKNKAVSDYLDDSTGEEIASSISHGIGTALAITAFVILVVTAARKGNPWLVTSFSIYGFGLTMLFLMSVFSHAFPVGKVKRFFQVMDYSSIYLLIAATYTPIVLGPIRGPSGWWVFGIIWGLAVCGVLFKLFLFGKFELISLGLYIAMGWLITTTIKPLLTVVDKGFIFWILAGGIFYTSGVIFYALKKMPYHHFVWHLFVLAGAACHFFGFLFYIA